MQPEAFLRRRSLRYSPGDRRNQPQRFQVARVPKIGEQSMDFFHHGVLLFGAVADEREIVRIVGSEKLVDFTLGAVADHTD